MMALTLGPALALCTLAALPVESLLVQVGPVPRSPAPARRDRAVVLLHGLAMHPFSKEKVARAGLRSWQQPDSLLVRRLAVESDVFALAYAQTVPVDQVAEAAALAE